MNALSGRVLKLCVVLTGRDMPTRILEVAHAATEMAKVKHAFDAGRVAKEGIDY